MPVMSHIQNCLEAVSRSTRYFLGVVSRGSSPSLLMRGSERQRTMKAFLGTIISLVVPSFLLLSVLTPLAHALEIVNPHYVPQLSERIHNSIQSHVRESLTAITTKDSQIDIDILGIPGLTSVDADLADSPVIIKTTSALKSRYSNRTVIQLNLCNNHNHCRHLSVPIRITLQQPVWVANHGVSAHQPLVKSNLTLEMREVSQIASHTLTAKTDLNQYETRIGIGSGQVLDVRKLVLKPDVRRNSRVRIVMVQSNGVHLGFYGKALQDGRIGETITVAYGLNHRKKKQQRGQVIRHNTVQVSM